MVDTNPNYSPIQSTPPLWAADYLNRDTVMPFGVRLDPAQFNAVDAVKVVVIANAAVDATSVAVAALAGSIPSGVVVDLSGKKFARLTAAAAKNAVSLTVAPLATALVAGDTGIYKGHGRVSVPSGTLIGRTFAERDAAAGWGPADVDGDGEIYLTTREISDITKDATTEVYRHNKAVKENYLPGFSGLAQNVKNKIRALYSCIAGKD